MSQGFRHVFFRFLRHFLLAKLAIIIRVDKLLLDLKQKHPYIYILHFHPSNVEAKDAKIFDNHPNSVMLVLIRKLSLSTLR